MLKPAMILVAISLAAWMKSPSERSAMKKENAPLTIDGPYVLYNDNDILVQYIDSADGKLLLRSNQLQPSQKDQLQLQVNTDEPDKTFNVQLHPKLTVEKTTYNKVQKMLVVSDIEGEFAAFRKLLQGNGVIDANYRWTFGNGHLVLLGDFVDRGSMVTEVLWLIYSLESQAEASGGKVHFILGNHEIMNMAGEVTYVHPRYTQHADSMHVPYQYLFSQHAELGRWLATKNITERIGSILFTHGGFSGYMNLEQIPLKAVNDTARLYYSDTSSLLPSSIANLLYSDWSPFWYRGYYLDEPFATQAQIDSTLELYDSHYIMTGHTVIAKQIVSAYEGKVFDLDVPHKLGYSEALLVEAGKFYRVNSKSEKMTIEPKK